MTQAELAKERIIKLLTITNEMPNKADRIEGIESGLRMAIKVLETLDMDIATPEQLQIWTIGVVISGYFAPIKPIA